MKSDGDDLFGALIRVTQDLPVVGFSVFFISKYMARWIDQKALIQSGFWSQDLLINQRAMIIRSIS
jgi:hypothetical protein